MPLEVLVDRNKNPNIGIEIAKDLVNPDKAALLTQLQQFVLDADKLASANNKAQKQIIKGMNHILKEAEMDRLKNIQTYSMPDLPLKKPLTEIIVKFIEQ